MGDAFLVSLSPYCSLKWGRIIVALTVHKGQGEQRGKLIATVLTSGIIDMSLYPFSAFLSYIARSSRDALDECLALLQEGGGLFCDWIEEGELLLLAVLFP